jgi:proteasome lid subunit RPN8/RPN11
MDASGLELKMDLIQKVLNLDSEKMLKKLLKVIERERVQAELSPAMVAHMEEQVRLADEDIAQGRVHSHTEVKAWIEAKKKSLRNGN